MPILKREPDATPGLFDLFDQPWQIAHVKPRMEKALARYLATGQSSILNPQSSIAFYLPQMEKKCTSARTSHVPLYPGYLFFRGDDAARRTLLRSNLVAQVLPVLDQPRFHAELRQIYDLQQSGATLVPIPSLEEGDLVTVRDGCFAGFHGTIVRIASEERLVVSISVLQRHVLVDFPLHAVERSFPSPHSSPSRPRRERRAVGRGVRGEGF